MHAEHCDHPAIVTILLFTSAVIQRTQRAIKQGLKDLCAGMPACDALYLDEDLTHLQQSIRTARRPMDPTRFRHLRHFSILLTCKRATTAPLEEQVQQVGAQMRDWHAVGNGVHSAEAANALMRRRARDAAGMGLGENLAVTDAEVTTALHILRNNKASGVDRMPAGCLEYAKP